MRCYVTVENGPKHGLDQYGYSAGRALGLAGIAREATNAANTYNATSADLASAATAPLASWQALKDAVRSSGEDGANALDAASAAANHLNTALTQAGTNPALEETTSAAGRAGGALKDAADVAKQAWEGAKSAIERTKEIASGVADDITGPLKQALKSGELSWQTFAGAVSGIAQNLANRLIDNAFKPIEDALFKALSGGFGGGMGGGSGGGIFGWIAKAIGGLFGGGSLFAMGGAFAQAGEITAFARGGVINQPTVFPFSKGIGLMGEAGPEAILPLRRGPGGRLGVDAGNSQAAPSATRIINVLDPGIVGDYLATPAGERAIINVIRRNRGGLDV